MRSYQHSAISTSPGALVYGRDMIIDNGLVPLLNQESRLLRQARNLEREKSRRVAHKYNEDDLVLIENPRREHTGLLVLQEYLRNQ